jgi:hypothetical protein
MKDDSEIKWIIVDINNLPSGEVLCANFEGGTNGFGEKIVGYIHNYFGKLHGVSESESIPNITHFIDIHKTFPK